MRYATYDGLPGEPQAGRGWRLGETPVTGHPIETVDDAVRAILRVGRPEAIILFGSRARGRAGEGSDIDLLIIERSDEPKHRRSRRYQRALSNRRVPIDLLVRTPEEVEEDLRQPHSFMSEIMATGKRLYTAT